MHNALSFLVIPFVAAVAVAFVSKVGRRVADWLAVVAAALMLWIASSFVGMGEAQVFASHGGVLGIDALSVLFLLLINGIGFLSLLYSTRYVEHVGGRAKFYALFMILLLGLNGVVLVRDLFSLYVYLEVASISAYVLVAFNLEFDGIESAMKYLLLSVVGTGLVILGIALVYMSLGTLSFDGIRHGLAAQAGNRLFLLAAAMFLAGFGLKAAIMPFHAWLPDAHPSAPAPVSAILSGVVIKVAGVYALVRIFMDLYPATPKILDVFLMLGLLSMTAGALGAYFQKDMKRMLAYSSISQIGYIMVGLGTGNLLGVTGALFHVFNHGIFKSLLFLNAGAIQYRLHTRQMDEMGGLENRMPVTNATAAFGTLSIAGIPPFNGFWSKLFIILGALTAHKYATATITTVFSLFTLGYFLMLWRKVFFGKLNEKWQDIKEAPTAMCASMVILAALCLATGIFFKPLVNRVIEPAAKVLMRQPAPVAHLGGH